MKPKNLQFPFTWEERRPALHDGVLIVPRYYDHHDNWIDETGLFSGTLPIAVEYCSGNGDWVIDRAKRFSDRLWVAVERQFERVRKIWSKMRNQGIENLLIVCGEAQPFTKYYLPNTSIDEVYVNFPDPWPKDRHAKHRLIQPPFIDEVSRVVKTGGTATFATDDPPYSAQMIDVMQNVPNWKSLLPAPYFSHEREGYGNSWFETLWREKGRQIHYIHYGRQ